MIGGVVPTLGGRPGEVPAFPSTPEEVPACFRQWLGGSFPEDVARIYHYATQVAPFNEAFRYALTTLFERCRL